MSHSTNPSSHSASSISSDELQRFKRQVSGWFQIDNQIRQYESIIRKLKEEKQELGGDIIGFMESHELTDLNTPNGKLKYSVHYTSQPLTKRIVTTKVGGFFEELGIANAGERTEQLINELYKNREKKKVVNIKRVQQKETITKESDFKRASRTLKNI
jgi:hypothetical protein